jgi:REP element-mobilizing transposase RayT
MSFVRIWIHIVFGTKNRVPFLTKDICQKVINHILDNENQKEIYIDFINGYKDHIHCLISLGSEQNIAKVVNLIKGESSYWINKNKITNTKFEWADEYFATSISESQIDKIRKYIQSQDLHHSIKSFEQEYEEFIKKYGFKYLG